MLEQTLVFLIVGCAAFFVGRSWVNTFKAKGGGCGSCGKCGCDARGSVPASQAPGSSKSCS
jgi:hypothetical protein